MSLVANLFFFITDEIKLIAKIFFFTAVNPHEAKLTYKEDTKLEDRLAMEAEEEKKFSNGDTYDEGEGEDKSTASSTSASSLSPKEQASQEMQVLIIHECLWLDIFLTKMIWSQITIFSAYLFLKLEQPSKHQNSSVKRQNGESQNVYFKKTKHTKFSEKLIFLTPWYAGLASFVFLKHPFWYLLCCLITDKLQ